jgi:hypothetical protein
VKPETLAALNRVYAETAAVLAPIEFNTGSGRKSLAEMPQNRREFT